MAASFGISRPDHLDRPRALRFEIPTTPAERRSKQGPRSFATGATGCLVFLLPLAGFVAGASLLFAASADEPVSKEIQRPSKGAVMVTSEPTGATVEINGSRAGVTPFLIKSVETDTGHVIRIVAEGHLTQYHRVAVGAGQELQLHAILDKSAVDEAPAEKIDKAMVQRTIRSAYDGIKHCNTEKQKGIVTVRFQIFPTGRVHNVEVKGPYTGTRLGECVNGVVSNLRFEPHKAPPTTVTFPFRLR